MRRRDGSGPGPPPAGPHMHYLDETHIFLFLAQMFILLLLTRAAGEVLRRWNQPVLTGEILVGILLGPTLLGRFRPGLHQALFPADPLQQGMLETVAWIGVLFLLLETGLEIDFSVAWRQRGKAMVIAFSDILIPMVVAFIPALFIPAVHLVNPDQRIIFGLFIATVMTISALPVAARVMHDLNLLKTDLGFLTMSALAVNDVVGWVLFTIILGVFTRGVFAPGPVLGVLALTVGFAALALTIGRRLSGWAFEAVRRHSLPEPATSLTIACLLGLLFGAFTQKLGIHALFGFFIAGVVMGEAKNLTEQTRSIISQIVHALFVPLFFANIGLKIDFAAHFNPFLVLLITVIGIAGRYYGAWAGVALARVPRINRDLISIAHTPGGMMEIVIALLALESGLITHPVFVAIVFGAVFSSLVMGPWMRASLSRRTAVSILDFLPESHILTDLEDASRSGVIRALSARVGGGPDRPLTERLVTAVEAREQEFGTAVGHGIAIPHARMTGVLNPVLAFARLPHGVEWNAPDGRPVHLVFLLATPEGTEDIHVQILARLARVMGRPESQRLLKQAKGPAQVRLVLERLLASPTALPAAGRNPVPPATAA